MLQRIQSVFLLLAITAIVLTYFIPVGYLGPYTLANYGLKSGEEGYLSEVSSYWYHLPLVFVLVINLFALAQYKNRLKQIAFLRLTFILFAGSFALLAVYIMSARNAYPELDLKLGISFVLPFFALAFNWLALRAIRKDEALVRSVDRIR